MSFEVKFFSSNSFSNSPPSSINSSGFTTITRYLFSLISCTVMRHHITDCIVVERTEKRLGFSFRDFAFTSTALMPAALSCCTFCRPRMFSAVTMIVTPSVLNRRGMKNVNVFPKLVAAVQTTFFSLRSRASQTFICKRQGLLLNTSKVRFRISEKVGI